MVKRSPCADQRSDMVKKEPRNHVRSHPHDWFKIPIGVFLEENQIDLVPSMAPHTAGATNFELVFVCTVSFIILAILAVMFLEARKLQTRKGKLIRGEKLL